MRKMNRGALATLAVLLMIGGYYLSLFIISMPVRRQAFDFSQQLVQLQMDYIKEAILHDGVDERYFSDMHTALKKDLQPLFEATELGDERLNQMAATIVNNARWLFEMSDGISYSFPGGKAVSVNIEPTIKAGLYNTMNQTWSANFNKKNILQIEFQDGTIRSYDGFFDFNVALIKDNVAMKNSHIAIYANYSRQEVR